MPTKIFVGRLAEGTTSEDILGLFRKFGTVTECDVISNYGFVVSITISMKVISLWLAAETFVITKNDVLHVHSPIMYVIIK